MMTDKYRRCHEMQTPQGPGFLAETGMRNAAAGSSFSFLPVASISEHVNTNYAEIMKAKLCPRASVSPQSRDQDSSEKAVKNSGKICQERA